MLLDPTFAPEKGHKTHSKWHFGSGEACFLAKPFPLANKKTDNLPSKAFPIPGMRKGSVVASWCSVWKIAAALRTSGCWSATFLDSVGSFFKSYSYNVGVSLSLKRYRTTFQSPIRRATRPPYSGNSQNRNSCFCYCGFTALKGAKQRQ